MNKHATQFKEEQSRRMDAGGKFWGGILSGEELGRLTNDRLMARRDMLMVLSLGETAKIWHAHEFDKCTQELYRRGIVSIDFWLDWLDTDAK